MWSAVSTTDPDHHAGPPGGGESNSERSIRSSLTLAVTIPWIVLLVLWLVGCATFVSDGVYSRIIGSGVRQVSLPAVTALDNLQSERRLTQEYLVGAGEGPAPLQAQQQRTDAALNKLNQAMQTGLSGAPEEVSQPMARFSRELARLPEIRTKVSAGTIAPPQVVDYYNGLFDTATEVFDVQSRIQPDSDTAQRAIAATSLFRASDLMAREATLVSTGLSTGRLTPEQHLQLVRLNGSYHTELDKNVNYLQPSVRQHYQELTTTDPDWARFVADEDKLLQTGGWTAAPPDVRLDEWQRVTETVSSRLSALTREQADLVSQQAVENGNDAITTAVAGAVAAGVFSLGFFFWTRRRYRAVIDGSLLPRLQRLSGEARTLATETLPSMMDRVRAGERVSIDEETLRGYGRDEIGQVAEAFRAFQDAALTAAINEANTQQGALSFYIGQTRRVQSALGPLPQRLDSLLQHEEDPDRLAALFALDESVTQARHVVENQLVLCGAAPGRRWTKARELTEVLRAAAAETKHHGRLRLGYVPAVSIAPGYIGDMLRMFAELFANAASFSPPGTDVHVEAVTLGSGLVVQISDQGVGMTNEVRERANRTMQHPPGFSSLVSSGDRGEQLGLFTVAQLAERNGWIVEFGVSIYQGTRAEVFVPQAHLFDGQQDDRRDSWSGDVPLSGATKPQPAVAARPTATAERAETTTAEAPAEAAAPQPDSAPAETAEDDGSGRPPLPQRVPYADLPEGFGEEPPTDRRSEPRFAPGLMTFFNAERRSRGDGQADADPDAN